MASSSHSSTSWAYCTSCTSAWVRAAVSSGYGVSETQKPLLLLASAGCLPDCLNAVVCEHAVGRENRDGETHGLRDEQAVERVAVVVRHAGGGDNVGLLDGDELNAEGRDVLQKVLDAGTNDGKFAATALVQQFRQARFAEYKHIGGILEKVGCASGEAAESKERPEDDMGVEERDQI